MLKEGLDWSRSLPGNSILAPLSKNSTYTIKHNKQQMMHIITWIILSQSYEYFYLYGHTQIIILQLACRLEGV